MRYRIIRSLKPDEEEIFRVQYFLGVWKIGWWETVTKVMGDGWGHKDFSSKKEAEEWIRGPFISAGKVPGNALTFTTIVTLLALVPIARVLKESNWGSITSDRELAAAGIVFCIITFFSVLFLSSYLANKLPRRKTYTGECLTKDF